MREGKKEVEREGGKITFENCLCEERKGCDVAGNGQRCRG